MKNLEKFIVDFRKGILGKRSSKGQCFAVCAPLLTLLQIEGYDVKLISGTVDSYGYFTNHYWLQLPDKTIIDPTADQFDNAPEKLPPVFIGKKPRFYRTDRMKKVARLKEIPLLR